MYLFRYFKWKVAMKPYRIPWKICNNLNLGSWTTLTLGSWNSLPFWDLGFDNSVTGNWVLELDPSEEMSWDYTSNALCRLGCDSRNNTSTVLWPIRYLIKYKKKTNLTYSYNLKWLNVFSRNIQDSCVFAVLPYFWVRITLSVLADA